MFVISLLVNIVYVFGFNRGFLFNVLRKKAYNRNAEKRWYCRNSQIVPNDLNYLQMPAKSLTIGEAVGINHCCYEIILAKILNCGLQ